MISLLPWRIIDKLYFCPITGCWLWAAAWESGDGYGKVWFNGMAAMAHRVVFELLVGPIPADHVLDHRCRQSLCCNPAHLEPVTVRENTRRGLDGLFQRAA